MARKGAMNRNSFALSVHPCSPGEALFIVVSLAATLGQHEPRRGDVPAKRCYILYLLF